MDCSQSLRRHCLDPVQECMPAPFPWLFSLRFAVFMWFIVEAHWRTATLDGVLWVATGVLGLNCLTEFVKIRSRM